jgi:hypothetical protein
VGQLGRVEQLGRNEDCWDAACWLAAGLKRAKSNVGLKKKKRIGVERRRFKQF